MAHIPATRATSYYPPDVASVSRARDWCRAELAAGLSEHDTRESLVPDVVMVVSELVTNAIRAGSPRTVLSLRVDEESITVAVTDSITALPELRRARPSDESGRGLQIVSALARDWGVTRWSVGKTVWAELAIGR